MKNALIIILIASLVLISGCGEETVETGPSPYKEGNQGLIAEFEPLGIEENGIYTIFEDETFPLQIVLKNKGEYDIKIDEVSVVIQGVPLSDFVGIAKGTVTNDKIIEKISNLNEEGGETIIDFGQAAKYIQPIPGSFYDLNFFITYTYAYKTYASVPEVCFKENLRDTTVCDIIETKDVFSSGAPIRITSAEEKAAGTGIIELDFKIENVAGGKSTLPGQEFSPQYNQLAYEIEPVTERAKWICTAAGRENQARLIDNKAVIRCKSKTPLTTDALYTKAIGLTLSYDYKDVIQEKLRIKKTI